MKKLLLLLLLLPNLCFGQIFNGQPFSGSYTPSHTLVANMAASTPFSCNFFRAGNAVTVSCVLNVDPTSTGVDTQLGISLPIASNLTGNDLAGSCAATASSTERAAGVVADATNDRANMQWNTNDSANHTMVCIFSYLIK